jgi:hypothetical protein
MNGEFRKDSIQGEFRGDFTRDTFTPEEHFIRVLSQQGRVWLDADWNEQTSILLHYIQTLAKDIIGDHGGWDNDSFKIETISNCEKDFSIHEGHYYVDGILCENDETVCYSKQPDYPIEKSLIELINDNKQNISHFLIYLDVWERHITCIQYIDKYRSIREVALGKPDTATRSKVIWQVKVMPLEKSLNISDCKGVDKKWSDSVLPLLQPVNRGLLRAKARHVDRPKPSCNISPEAKYTGEGNYLYRVEIHRGGKAKNTCTGTVDLNCPATFKWSRENGSVEFPLSQSIGYAQKDNKDTAIAILEHLRCSDYSCLSEDDWVEIVDDDYTLQNRAEPLWQIKSIDSLSGEVTLERFAVDGELPLAGANLDKHPLLRRWDQKEGELKPGNPINVGQLIDGAVAIIESDMDDKENVVWIPLENGIKVMFQMQKGNNDENIYRTGDYWLIPARAATGDIEWPKEHRETQQLETPKPRACKPHGIEHHYAPLGLITLNTPGTFGSMNDANISHCRRICKRPCKIQMPP